MHYLSFTWNPSEGIDLGFFLIRYYSLMFVVAFSLGWFITKRIFVNENLSLEKLDSLFIYMVIAILLGARLGHVLFYQSDLILKDPISVLLPFRTVPEFEYTGFQGLASHGAAIGVIIAMFIYSKKVLQKPVLWILDRVVVAVACGAIFVRIGNFINSLKCTWIRRILNTNNNSKWKLIIEKCISTKLLYMYTTGHDYID